MFPFRLHIPRGSVRAGYGLPHVILLFFVHFTQTLQGVRPRDRQWNKRRSSFNDRRLESGTQGNLRIARLATWLLPWVSNVYSASCSRCSNAHLLQLVFCTQEETGLTDFIKQLANQFPLTNVHSSSSPPQTSPQPTNKPSPPHPLSSPCSKSCSSPVDQTSPYTARLQALAQASCN